MTGKMLLFVFEIAIMYLTIFYFLLPVNIKGVQAIIHILVSVGWSWVLFVPIREMQFGYQIVIAFFLELGYIFFTIYLFTDGDIFRNFFLFWFMYQITNMASTIYISLLNPQFMNILLLPDVDRARIDDFIPFYIVLVILFFVFRPLVRKIAEFSEGYTFIYRYVVAGMLVILMIEYVIRKGEYYFEGKRMNYDMRAFCGIMTCGVLIYIIMRYKRKSMEQQKMMLERATILVGEKYKHIVKENHDMRQLRHEINRHTEMVKGVKEFVPYDEMRKYIQALEQKNSVFLELSLSGNLYLDSMVEKYYKILKKQGIILETVLEPIKLEEQTAMELICVVEEMFTFILDDIHHKKWCRFSVRMRNNMILCQMETRYGGKLEYYRRSLLDMIGDEMFVRQHLAKTKNITNQRNGYSLYRHEKNKVMLATMISQQKGELYENWYL